MIWTTKCRRSFGTGLEGVNVETKLWDLPSDNPTPKTNDGYLTITWLIMSMVLAETVAMYQRLLWQSTTWQQGKVYKLVEKPKNCARVGQHTTIVQLSSKVKFARVWDACRMHAWRVKDTHPCKCKTSVARLTWLLRPFSPDARCVWNAYRMHTNIILELSCTMSRVTNV